MKYYIHVLKNYVNFKGRASRAEFWYFILFNFIVSFILGFIEGFFNIAPESGVGILSIVYFIAIQLPVLALWVRRVQDVNKPWWTMLIPIYSLILALTKGTVGPNKYGPEPVYPWKATTLNPEQPKTE